MSWDETNCILCKKTLRDGDVRTVLRDAIDSYITASKECNDSIVPGILRDRQSITVHVNCAKKYRKVIATNITPSNIVSRRSSSENFDFANYCFMCGKIVDFDQCKKPQERRKTVHRVTTSEFRDRLLSRFQHSTDADRVTIYNRLLGVADLVAVKACYHYECNQKYLRAENCGDPVDSDVVKAIRHISKYMHERPDECQFSVTDMLSTCKNLERWPLMRTLSEQLNREFKDEIITQYFKGDLIISWLKIGRKLLAKHWYETKKANIEQEKLRVIDEAAALTLREIQKMPYTTKEYPPSDTFLHDSSKYVPEALRRFLDGVIAKNKLKKEDWDTRINSIAHSIIASVRPNSFISPVLLSIAAIIHRKYGTRELIEMLFACGFCSSYDEVERFLSAIIEHKDTRTYSEGLTQVVFDNADHNADTRDGHGTFHAMGGIKITTPKTAVSKGKPINRLSKRLSAQRLAELGRVDLKTFSKSKEGGFKNIIYTNIDDIHPIDSDIQLSPTDFVWIWARINDTGAPGYNGFMEKFHADKLYEVSKVEILPFINASASNLDTIYTSLLMADKIRQDVNQHHIFVTYDCPLFLKSCEILTHVKLPGVLLRLGGLHLWFSFANSINFIMKDSGLKDVFQEMFAENTCEKVLNGSAYSRAVRGHLLVHAAIAKLIIEEAGYSDVDSKFMDNMILKENSRMRTELNSARFKKLFDKFHATIAKIEERGPTAKLWILYFKLVTILKQFIEAERSGDWELHLLCVQRMIPYFHATGHFMYVRAVQLYMQQMLRIQEIMDDDEFKLFTQQGYFTIRRTDKFWSGIWSDMAIEQILMRSMKTHGGLTRGRGITDSVLTQWVLSSPAMIELSEQLQNYTDVTFTTTEQHVDSRKTRIAKDVNDLMKVVSFFSKYNPFVETTVVKNIVTGLKGDETINCYDAQNIGKELAASHDSKTFDKIKLERNKRVRSLQCAVATVAAKDGRIAIDPTLLFQRIAVAVNGNKNLKFYLSFELSPWPLSLFDSGLMRKTTKATLYDSFAPIDMLEFPEEYCAVLDGGYLLHKIPWLLHQTFEDIVDSYLVWVAKHFPQTDYIVFDGYGEGTKSAERMRRKEKGVSRDIDFDLNTRLTVPKDKFLSNDENKNRLIKFLIERFRDKLNMTCKQAKEDADRLIVQTAIEASEDLPVVIVGEDVDLLVLMTQNTPPGREVFFLKYTKDFESSRLYNCDSLIYRQLKPIILFVHAFTGCDSTSAYFRQGKNKFLKLLHDNVDLAKKVAIFNRKKVDKSKLVEAGCQAVKALYSKKVNQKLSLNEFRYLCFRKNANKNKFSLSTLPPTEAAATQHFYRTYHQVQLWFGNQLDEKNWGWLYDKENKVYTPNFTEAKLVPDNVLKNIRCKCKKDCTKNCGCVKHGLNCSEFCETCEGRDCSNHIKDVMDVPEENQDEEDERFDNQNEIDSDDDITYDIDEDRDLEDDMNSDCPSESDAVDSDDEFAEPKVKKFKQK